MRRTGKANLFMLSVILAAPLLSVVLGIIGFFAPVPLWLLLMAGELSILICILFYGLFTKTNVVRTLPFRKMKKTTIVWCILLSICTIPVMTVVNLLTQFFTENALTDVIMQVYSLPFWVLFGILAVMPPVIEEIAFRGILFQNYRKNGVLLGVFLSAFLFGLMHMNINQMCYAAVMGMIAALMVEATGSILSSVLLHFVVNGSNVLMIGVSSLLSGTTFAELYAQEAVQMEALGKEAVLLSSLLVYGVLAIAGCAAGVFVFWKLCCSAGRWEYMKAVFHRRIVLPEKEKTVDVWLILAILIGIALMIANEIASAMMA